MSLLAPALGSVTAAAAAGALAADHGLYRRAAALWDRAVYCGPTERRSVALTFDDGPCPQTALVLDVLAREKVEATFFQLGMQAERYPDLAREVQRAGHEVGNHGFSHASLRPQLHPWSLPSFGRMWEELHRTQVVLQGISGTLPRLFRPPYGHRWVGLDLVQRRLGLQQIQWTAIGHDWEWPAERVAAHVLAHVRPGAILCLHDGRDTQPAPDITETVTALRLILRSLREQGYEVGTVRELLRPA